MGEQNTSKQTCNCAKHHPVANNSAINENVTPLKHFWNTLKALGSFLLSLLIAFFPKCPMCWAVYMSMFGGIGLAKLPYLKWLLPVLMVMFALNLFLLYRKGRERGYGPFFLSLAGAIIILLGRNFFIDYKEILYAGMAMVLVGSLWSGFSGIRFRPAATPTF